MCRAAVGALALDAAGCRVARVVRAGVVARRWGRRGALASSGLGCRWATCGRVPVPVVRVCVYGARCRTGSGNRRRTHHLVFTHDGKTGGNRVHVRGLNGHRGGPLGGCGGRLDGLLLALLLGLRLGLV